MAKKVSKFGTAIMPNMLLHNAKQLLTVRGGPQRGGNLGTLTIVEDGAVLMREGRIVEVGASSDLLAKYPDETRFEARGKVVMPGFVDAHTHPIWAGDRAAEFEQRLQGRTYLEILDGGGGILSTVKATRTASMEELLNQTRQRFQRMFAHGSTTIEAKTGYGLDLKTELRLLEALVALDDEGPWDLAITFLGAHAIPAEFKGRGDEFTVEISANWLPEVKKWWQGNGKGRELPFVDVFCETGAFSLDQSHQILETAIDLGFPTKIHADEFDNLGGASLAMKLGATSADHLVSTSAREISELGSSELVAVALPATPFGLAETHYAKAKEILAANGLLAVASDLNPGTAWCENIQFALALACRYLKLTPAQAIAASTINGAAAVRRQAEVGSIEVGKQADLLILEVNDFRHLGYRFGTNLVHTVIKKGVPYPVQTWPNGLDPINI
jgi:imidazolonepropionase